MLEHGGGIRRAAQQFAIPLAQWLDLSTGINPHGLLPESLPASCWARLPEENDGLEDAACVYYGARYVCAVAGSQAAIQALPKLRPATRVAVLSPTYAEHQHAWEQAGHQVLAVDYACMERDIDLFDVVVIVNPNNPTGRLIAPEVLLAWQKRLKQHGGWLVIDEAFMDVTPEFSLSGHADLENLIILRSLGKFFGLAGARVGFVLAAAELLVHLREVIGPWSLTGPSRWVARQALANTPWQERTRETLPIYSERLRSLLHSYNLKPMGGTALFQWVPTVYNHTVWDVLARQGIWVRRFAPFGGVRFGLPDTEEDWQRLEAALATMRMPL